MIDSALAMFLSIVLVSSMFIAGILAVYYLVRNRPKTPIQNDRTAPDLDGAITALVRARNSQDEAALDSAILQLQSSREQMKRQRKPSFEKATTPQTTEAEDLSR